MLLEFRNIDRECNEQCEANVREAARENEELRHNAKLKKMDLEFRLNRRGLLPPQS